MHLAEISRVIAPNAHAALVLDGAGYHVAADLVVPDNITLVPLPPYAPELNPVENVWEYLRGNKLSITVYDDYEHILDASCEAWMFFANDKRRVASSGDSDAKAMTYAGGGACRFKTTLNLLLLNQRQNAGHAIMRWTLRRD